MMNTENTHIPSVSRRAFIKGLGATLTLPFLPSLAWSRETIAGEAPRRWASVIFANGVYEPDWWAKGAGKAMELSPTLAPLNAFREDLTLLNGLHIMDRFPGVSGGPHTGKFSNLLSGAGIVNSKTPNLAQSIDYFMAAQIGKMTPVPSLTLGIEPPYLGTTGGVPKVYYSTISWSSATTPVIPEISPRRAFDRLFDTSALLRNKSVLDAALEDVNSLRGKLSYWDQQKLDEYTQSVREIEHRVQMASSEERFDQWQPSISTPTMDRPEDGKDWSLPEHHRLMIDILVLALQMDKTRIATLLMESDTSGLKFNFLENVSSAAMHGGISHHQSKAEIIAQYKRVNIYHTELLAYMLEKMRSIDEGNGTLLDNTMLLFGSNLMDGDKHDATHLPLLLAGGRNCDIQPGRVLTYENSDDRLICNLHLSCAQRMGINVNAFGNSAKPLPLLS